MTKNEPTGPEMQVRDILEYLPHRYPFLLIDRVVSCEPGKSLTALKNVTANEHFFVGHFPGRPIMPGVLILEAMAQATGILAFRTMDAKPDGKNLYLFVGVDQARFRRQVIPGDQLHLTVDLVNHKRGMWKFSAVAQVAGETVCTAQLMSAHRPV